MRKGISVPFFWNFIIQPKIRTKKLGMKKIVAPPKEELEAKYLQYGATISQIAREYRISNPVLRNWLKSYQIPLKDHKEASIQANNRKRNSPPSKEILEKLYQNNSIKQLETIFSVGQDTIYSWLDLYHIDRKSLSDACKVSKENAWNNMIPDKYVFIEAYKELKCVKALEEKFGLSSNSIRKLFKDYHIEVVKPLRSYAEIKLFFALNSISKFVWNANDRSIINPYELDLVCPERKLALEYCGLYWHSEFTGEKERDYHKKKMERCNSAGYDLITVFESDDLQKVIALLSSKLAQNERIFARQCNVLAITPSQARIFNEENHLHGHNGGSVNLGLFHNGNLVQVLVMGKSRFSDKFEWECVRMTSALGKTVVGGASKLFTAFRNMINPNSMITYADLRFGSGKVYESCGFTRVDNTNPNYWYFNRSNPNTLLSRIVFQKHKLKSFDAYDESLTEWEIMKLSRYDRIWDCGNAKFVWYK